MKPLILILLFFIPLSVFPQCDNPGKSIPGSLGYKKRGRHCEGFYGRSVNGDFQIVHFAKGKLAYSSTQPEKIKLTVPVKMSSPVNIRAMGIPRNLFYQMDTELNSGETFSWDTGEVLLKNQRTKDASMLGLLGFIQSNSRRVYVPVQVNQVEDEEPLQIKLMAPKTVKQLEWRLQGQTDYKKIRGGAQFITGRAIIITFPNDVPPGEYTLEIKGKERDGVTNVTQVLRIRI